MLWSSGKLSVSKFHVIDLFSEYFLVYKIAYYLPLSLLISAVDLTQLWCKNPIDLVI